MSEIQTQTDLRQLAERRFQMNVDLPRDFFSSEADQVAGACLAMARRFHRKGRLLAFAAGNAVTDAQHVSVEFVHPVIMGKRALPAIALGTDIAATVGLARGAGWEDVYAQQVATIGCPEDMAMGIDPAGNDISVLAGLAAAQEQGLLTIGLAGNGGGRMVDMDLDFCFVVPTTDIHTIQETHETLYHILWELVHVFFEHKGLLEKGE